MRACIPAIAALWLALASAAAQARPALPDHSAALPPPPSPARPADGAIFHAGYAPLYSGTRARAVGDALTVVLAEQTSAAKTVASKSQKGGSAAITPPTAGPLSFLNPDALNLASTSSFNGQGNAGQTSTLNAVLSVTIAEVRANGTAIIRGEKRMLLSQGHEWVRFSGIVRLIDIDEDNRISSARVADAQIEYAGKGALQRASRQGWLGRFFNAISPF